MHYKLSAIIPVGRAEASRAVPYIDLPLDRLISGNNTAIFHSISFNNYGIYWQ